MIKKTKLFDAFRHAMLNNPKASRKEQFAEFLETVQSNPGYLDLLAEDYFYRQSQTWEAKEIEPGSHAIVGTPAMQRRTEAAIERREESAKRVERAQAELAASIRPFIWFEMLVEINGKQKKLRECTGAELKKLGGAFLELSTHLKPTERLDSKLSEKDIRNVFARFGGKRRSAGAELHA